MTTENPSFPPEFAPYLDEILATAKPSVCFTLQAGPAELWDSKVGGNPYLPDGMEYPKNSEGRPLALLAQINFAQMPSLPGYPADGILQFYLDGNDDLMGMDFDNPCGQNGFRVLYHPEIQTEGLQRHFPAHEGEDCILPFPLGSEYRILFQPAAAQYMTLEDHRFADSLPSLNRFLEEAAEKDGYDWSLHEKYAQVANGSTHRIGGYPYFTQYDPREGGLAEYELLFQLDSEWGDEGGIDVMWGDAGVGGFFIRPEDLKKRDFSQVVYNWDCC